MAIKRHVSHIKSKVVNNGKPQLPESSDLMLGEIAINYAKDVETISIKNEDEDVVTFSSDEYYTKQKLGSGFTGDSKTVTEVISEDERVISEALIDLSENKLDITDFNDKLGSGFTGSNSGVTVTSAFDNFANVIDHTLYLQL